MEKAPNSTEVMPTNETVEKPADTLGTADTSAQEKKAFGAIFESKIGRAEEIVERLKDKKAEDIGKLDTDLNDLELILEDLSYLSQNRAAIFTTQEFEEVKEKITALKSAYQEAARGTGIAG